MSMDGKHPGWTTDVLDDPQTPHRGVLRLGQWRRGNPAAALGVWAAERSHGYRIPSLARHPLQSGIDAGPSHLLPVGASAAGNSWV